MAMIDVLMIMLVFFMVTSTYMNLRMIPVARSTEDALAGPDTAGGSPGAGSNTLLVRLGADGRVSLRGQSLSRADLGGALAETLARRPEVQIVVLPSARARTQDLVSLLDSATAAGATRLRIVRLETPL